MDDTEPVEVEDGDDSELAPMLDTWDAGAHHDELLMDPAVSFGPADES